MIEFVAGRCGNQSAVNPEILKLSKIIEAGMPDPNFFDWCSDLAGFGARYYKHSDNQKEHGFDEGDLYIGEWSF